jgi:hypothetical protein
VASASARASVPTKTIDVVVVGGDEGNGGGGGMGGDTGERHNMTACH